MMHLVSTNETLQFSHSHAEQSFFDWYFRFERWTLPVKYNAVAGHLKRNGEVTNGGTKPVIIHYSWAKPMELHPDTAPEQKIAVGCAV
jgi:lipopolysaccharide biosynthesis glycosyltransferase